MTNVTNFGPALWHNEYMKTVILMLLAILLLAPNFSAAEDTIAYLDDSSHFISQLLGYINHYRQSIHLRPLSFDNRLATLAQGHCSAMQHSGTLSHDRFDERYNKSGHSSCVENVGWNYRTARELFDAWRHSSGHDRNMRAEDIRRAGISRVGAYVTFFACN